MKFCYIDFEYNHTSDPLLNLVSVSFKCSDSETTYTYWLHNNPEELDEAEEQLKEINRDGYIFVAWAVTAEARSFISLNIDPLKCKWVDLFLEYRCLTNHNHSLMYGKQLIDGRVKKTSPPKNKWDMTEEEKGRFNFSKPQHNLAAATFKLLKTKIDTEFKDATRDIIISCDENRIESERESILRYNESDIQYLPKLHSKILHWYEKLLFNRKGQLKTLHEEMLLRGEYAARTAVMESIGYPIDVVATKAFSRSVAPILWETQNEINELFPDILPFNCKNYSFTWSHVRTKEWVKEWCKRNKNNWLKTDTNDFSLSLDAWKKHFDFRHDYPKDNFGAQMVRYLTLKQNLNGFSPTSKNSFWDKVGSDGRVRPYFGIYGSQSARSQPAATGFLFLKSAWMRSLCVPPKGKAICGIDYKSQEFLLAAVMSCDDNMIKSYQSGDPYLYLAKLARAVPMNGKREDYENERNMFKSTTLGLSYGMTKYGLANKLSNDMGRKVSTDEAQLLVDKFNGAYSVYHRWSKRIAAKYKDEGYLKLPCGWYLWKDNKNEKSFSNFPIQGMGSSIMRRAVSLAQDRGLKVIFTLHDAIYIEFDSDDLNDCMELSNCMVEAFNYYLPTKYRGLVSVGLDGNLWSRDFPSEEEYIQAGEATLKRQSVYIDGRSRKEYDQFKRYFTPETYSMEEV